MNQTGVKKVLITGAGGLLGAELVRSLVDCGYSVLATDVDSALAASRFDDDWRYSYPDSLEFKDLDLTDEQAVKKIFSVNDDLDGAVNAAYPKNSAYGNHFFDVKLSDFNENLALHLGSAFLFMKECAFYFKESPKDFSLVNIASVYGVCAPDFKIYEGTHMTMPVEYAAIKSGLLHLNRYVVNYISDSRFRINSVSPGGLLNGQEEPFIGQYTAKTHGTGLLSASDIAAAVKFLVSDDSYYVTGQNLIIDDGFSL